MRKLLLSFILACVSMFVHAYDFSVKNSDGVNFYYSYVSKDDKTVAFGGQYTIGKTSCPYTGDFEVPSSVVYNDVEYTVTQITNTAFLGSKVTSIIIPNTVTNIGENAFHTCRQLQEIKLPETIVTIGSGAFYSCYSLKSITLPGNLTSIGGMSFYGCSELQTITIPAKVNIIGGSMFNGCTNLQEVNILGNVTNIGSSAFGGCDNLKEITILSQRPPICESNTFLRTSTPSVKYLYSDVTLNVPSTAYNAYVAAPIWFEFPDIRKIDGSETEDNARCAEPQISFSDKTLRISCITPQSKIHYSYYLSNVGTVELEQLIPTVTKTTNALTVIAYATAEGLKQSTTVIQTFPFDATVNDINGDNRITVADVTTLIDVIVNQ